MNSNLIIEIMSGHDRPESRRVGSGDKQREVFVQRAWVHNGSPFPFEIKLSFDALPDCLQVGKYSLCPSSFKAGQYGDLEINRFSMKFIPLANDVKKVG